MERGLGLGVAAAALVVCAAGARADERAGAGPATGEGGTCELARVTDRSRVSSFRCSCHDARSTNAKHVVDPARLCYACHQL